MENFVLLLKALKQKLGSSFSVSVALGVGVERTKLSYDVPAIFEISDFVSLKTFNLRGIGDTKTGIHSALYDYPNDVNSYVTSLISLGVPSAKIMLGIPMYGNAFTLEDANKHVIGSPASAAGSMRYQEICQRVKSGSLSYKYESTPKVPYAYNEKEWVGYEDVKSVKEKATYIKNKFLGGAMIKSIDTEDYDNRCGEGIDVL